MAVWKALYALVWITFLDIVIIGVPWLTDFVFWAHTLLGLLILIFAFYNKSRLNKTQAPARLKRISKATAGLAVFQAVLGLILAVETQLRFGETFVQAIVLLHLITALAILTQASSVATAYDMWEERELVVA